MGNAFSKTYTGIVNAIVTPAEVSEAYDPNNTNKPPQSIKYNALWDTGASITLISPRVVTDLKLAVIGPAKIRGVNSSQVTSKHIINLSLPNNVTIVGLVVLEGNIGDIDILIGMDVITMGDLAITNKNRTEFSFHIPSSGDFEFLKHKPPIEAPKSPPASSKKKIGRNDPCHCGSGLKYKKCCGK